LPHPNNPSPLFTEENGLIPKIYHKNTQDILLASEKKLELTEKITGEFSESINLKKLNNSLSAHLKNPGKCMMK